MLPSLVNAHTHLELSYLRGMVEPADRFLDWIRALIAARRRYADPRDSTILAAAQGAIHEARASGTGLIGDVSNTLVTAPLLQQSGMPGRLFYELLGFNASDPSSDVVQGREPAPMRHSAQRPQFASVWRRTRRIRSRPACLRQSARISTRTPETCRACTLANRRRRSNFCEHGPRWVARPVAGAGRVDRLVARARDLAGDVPGGNGVSRTRA